MKNKGCFVVGKCQGNEQGAAELCVMISIFKLLCKSSRETLKSV